MQVEGDATVSKSFQEESGQQTNEMRPEVWVLGPEQRDGGSQGEGGMRVKVWRQRGIQIRTQRSKEQQDKS